MSYKVSQIDKELTNLFENNTTSNTLVKISITNGEIRGLSPVEIEFKYPITAIVGENGAGKSTILALATCAFHNDTTFCPQSKVRVNAKKPHFYYTYGDFFTFSKDEPRISGVEIQSNYRSKDGTIKQDIRKKKLSGKWNDFNRRPKRVVSYLGISRIVPPSESNPHRNYCRYFTKANFNNEQMQQLRESMSHVIGRSYSEIELMKYNSYHLFKAKRNSVTYTGFNMGAGENAVLGLILEIMSAGAGALIVVDEIELGLHTQAQIRLIEELKKLCKRYKCQIICSTHSKDVLQKLPPCGRLFLKRTEDNSTVIIPNITAEYAFGKLSGQNSNEVSVLVEDEIGEKLLTTFLSKQIRERINIISIGSDQAVLSHIAVHYREKIDSFIAFLDGDKQSEKNKSIRKISKILENQYKDGLDNEKFNEYMDARLHYLPGSSSPEREVIERVMRAEDFSYLESNWDVSTDDIIRGLELALNAEKHNEFYEIAKAVSLPKNQVILDLMRFYKELNPNVKTEIENAINAILEMQ